MSNVEHQTSVLMNNNNDMTDANGGSRLLSASDEDKQSVPRTRMTRPSKFSVRAALIVLLILCVAVAIIIIVTLTVSSPPPTHVSDPGPFTPLTSTDGRCIHDVIVGKDSSGWRLYHSRDIEWQKLPKVTGTEYVLISPKYEIKRGPGAGTPGVQVSAILPPDNEAVFIMAVKDPRNHTNSVKMQTRSKRCESAVLDDPVFFGANVTYFRVYVFFKNHVDLKGAKFTVTLLPRSVLFRDMNFHSSLTPTPKFAHLKRGRRDQCSVEVINRTKHDCSWWNVEGVDNADFEKLDRHECISSGVQSGKWAAWFFGVTAKEGLNETRALLVSPVIERKTPSLLLTLWYMFKCEGPQIRIHLVPANRTHHTITGTTNVVSEVNKPASHIDWKFTSREIDLPDTYDSYHVVLEAIVPSSGICKGYACTTQGRTDIPPIQPKSPMLGIDDISLELMHETCKNADESNVMDCKFQEPTGKSTTCLWESSGPEYADKMEPIEGMEDYFDDWKPVNSGDDDSDHGATSQHFVGRGYIMTFDATGRRGSESHVRTPLLRAKDNCSCTMTFLYLMRGFFTPRMQVNLVYGADPSAKDRPTEPQWSLFGNQSDQWQTAVIALNLRRDKPFQIEIRVLDVIDSQGDIHFDDVKFTQCDMEKYK